MSAVPCCDIFSPCSVGAVVNDRTLERFRCAGIAGAANNVLAESQHGTALMKRGIAYGPDYLVNSGGLIRCQQEVLDGPTDDARIFEKVSQIQDQTRSVIRVAEELGIGTEEAANRMAEERLHEVRQAGKAWNALRTARPACPLGFSSYGFRPGTRGGRLIGPPRATETVARRPRSPPGSPRWGS